MSVKHYFLFLLLASLGGIGCVSNEDDSMPDPPPMAEPLPQSSFSFKIDDTEFVANPDSAFLNDGNVSTKDLAATADDDSITMNILLQYPLGTPFEETSYSFTEATNCLQSEAFCASFVVAIESNTGVAGYGSRFEGNTFNITFEIADFSPGGHIKGTFSGQVSVNDNFMQRDISEGIFDLYIARE